MQLIDFDDRQQRKAVRHLRPVKDAVLVSSEVDKHLQAREREEAQRRLQRGKGPKLGRDAAGLPSGVAAIAAGEASNVPIEVEDNVRRLGAVIKWGSLRPPGEGATTKPLIPGGNHNVGAQSPSRPGAEIVSPGKTRKQFNFTSDRRRKRAVAAAKGFSEGGVGPDDVWEPYVDIAEVTVRRTSLYTGRRHGVFHSFLLLAVLLPPCCRC